MKKKFHPDIVPAAKKKNKFTASIFLRDVKDDKQLFKLNLRPNSPYYNVQLHLRGVSVKNAAEKVYFTSKQSGRTFSRTPKTKVYIKP